LPERARLDIGDAGAQERDGFDHNLNGGNDFAVVAKYEVTQIIRAPADGTVRPRLQQVGVVEFLEDGIPAVAVHLVDLDRIRGKGVRHRLLFASDHVSPICHVESPRWMLHSFQECQASDVMCG
jgi:hypothetical protein